MTARRMIIALALAWYYASGFVYAQQLFDGTVSRELTEAPQIENCQHLWPPGWNAHWTGILQKIPTSKRLLLDGESYLPSHGQWQRPVDPFIAMRDDNRLTRPEALELVADAHRLWLSTLKAVCALARTTGTEVWVYGATPGHARGDIVFNPLEYRQDVSDAIGVLDKEVANELHSTGGGFIVECYVNAALNAAASNDQQRWWAQQKVGVAIRERVYSVKQLGFRAMPVVRVTDIGMKPLHEELLRIQVHQCRAAGDWVIWNGPIVPNAGRTYPKITDEQKKILLSPL